MNSSAANRSALLHASSISLIGERLLHFRLNRNSRRRDGSIDRSGSSAMFACRSCAVQRREVGGKTRERRQRRRVGGPPRRECEVDPRWQVSLRSAPLWPPTSSPRARTGPPWSRSAAVSATRRTPVHSGFSGGRTPGLTDRFHLLCYPLPPPLAPFHCFLTHVSTMHRSDRLGQWCSCDAYCNV
jgi:hypothetical protein